MFLGALLGSIFGLMGTFSSFMGYTEDLYEKFEKRLKDRSHSKDMKSKSRILKSEFGISDIKNRSSKVIPFESSISSIAITCN